MPESDALFVIVRHGNTFEPGEPARRIGAQTDLVLTQTGLAQAQALATHFATLGWRISQTLVSPLQRTRQTAEAIMASQGTGVLPEPAEFLREIDHGPDENRTEAQVLARIGTQALADWDSAAIVPPDWTVDADVRITAWRALFANARAGQPPVLLVTSNGAARFALLAAGVRPEAGLKLPTGSYGVIRIAADGTPTVSTWGVRP